MIEKKKRDPFDMLMIFLGICTGVAILSWTAGTVVLVIMMIREMP